MWGLLNRRLLDWLMEGLLATTAEEAVLFGRLLGDRSGFLHGLSVAGEERHVERMQQSVISLSLLGL
jgi:hypothetical protein